MRAQSRSLLGRLHRLAALALLLPAVALATGAQEPIDVLRANVAAGIEVLTDTSYSGAEGLAAQRDRLCAIAHEMFDTRSFARLTLAGAWKDFAAAEQDEFVEVFGDFLCRYYLSRLQARYNDESVTFHGQEMKAANRASVSASVVWRDIEFPVEVRMVRREGRWRAYDIVISGISAVLLYRAQFQARLLESSPAELIAELRRRIREQG